MKILFIHFGREHLGIEYLSSMLKKEGHEVYLAHQHGLFSREDNVLYSPVLERLFARKDLIAEKIRQVEPGLVVFSVYTTTYQWALDSAKKIKDAFGLPILFGGIHATLVPEEVIKQGSVDYLIRGEGEFALSELVANLERGLSLSGIKNLWYKKNNAVFRNELREPISDLDSLPLPDKDLFKESVRYKDDYMIMTSRGCPYNCSYCCESYLNDIYKNRYFRRRSVGSVLDELSMAKEKYGIREVMFFDSIFFTDKSWLRGLFKGYKEKIKLPFRCTGHTSCFDDETAGLIKDAGGYCIEFGIQTFNEKVRRDYLNRFETNLEIKNVFRICDSLKIKYDIDLMFGLPGMTENDYKSALEFINDCKWLNRLKCYYLTYYPRLSIVDKAVKTGILDENDIADIVKGNIGNWFHFDSIKSQEHKKWKRNFTKIYKLYPIMPKFLRQAILKNDAHKYFFLVPNFIIVLFQLFIGLKNKDYRFKIYLNNYLHNFIKIFTLGRLK